MAFWLRFKSAHTGAQHDEATRRVLSGEAVGPAGAPGRHVELGVDTMYIKWRLEGDTVWTNLIALAALMGAPGPAGLDGADGKTPMLRVADEGEDAGWLEYRYSVEDAWTKLFYLGDLNGGGGGPGGGDIIFDDHGNFDANMTMLLEDFWDKRMKDFIGEGEIFIVQEPE